MSKAVCRFRELTALLGLLLDNIPIKGIKFCGCRGLRFILLLEETQETTLLLSFLRTLICYDGNTLGKFFAEFYLLFKQLGDIEELDLFLRHQYPQAIYPFTGIVILELTKDAIHFEAFGTIERCVGSFPFENGFTEHRKVEHMYICLMHILPETVNLFHFTLQSVHLSPFVQVRIYDTTN